MTTTDARKRKAERITEKRELDLVNFLEWLDTTGEVEWVNYEVTWQEVVRRFLAQDAANDSGVTMCHSTGASAPTAHSASDLGMSSGRSQS